MLNVHHVPICELLGSFEEYKYFRLPKKYSWSMTEIFFFFTIVMFKELYETVQYLRLASLSQDTFLGVDSRLGFHLLSIITCLQSSFLYHFPSYATQSSLSDCLEFQYYNTLPVSSYSSTALHLYKSNKTHFKHLLQAGFAEP